MTPSAGKNQFRVIGLMSGTSIDGLDIADCLFRLVGDVWTYDLRHLRAVDYDDFWRTRLKNSIDLSGLELLVLHQEYGTWLGEQVRQFMADHRIHKVDAVASHGHTVFHQIDKQLTYQIGAGQQLANACQQPVICDFRSLDVALGGQGAPLVPIGDLFLFGRYDACLNLGGIANVSFEHRDQRIAYDISPANMLLNPLAQRAGLSYDAGGALARKGQLLPELLDQLNALSYYDRPFPKSLGYEWYLEQVAPLLENNTAAPADLLYTAVQHISQQISQDLRYYHPQGGQLLATGGGAKNTFLIETLQTQLGTDWKVMVPPEDLIDYKEALVFAFMGVRYLREEVNCLASVTGAKRDSVGGRMFWP